ncbi:MAG: hypothetical protein K9J13_17275, partial [Saprospiraceae bacterium]|nr:hypothetical protein [Saprospiraceae bacterium]
MGKLKIDDLHYIVMEGGGARGNTYVGAIKALENEFKKKLLNDTNISSPKVSAEKLALLRQTKDINQLPPMSIMDFEEEDSKGNKIPLIKGVAGSSAGAITSFAVVLGLNSDEITTVLDYKFENFLSKEEKIVGKYRMINDKSELMIGEDETIGVDKAKVLGGSKSEPFYYYLDKNKTNISGKANIAFKRSFIINLAIKVVIDGVISNIEQIGSVLSKLKTGKESKTGLGKVWEKIVAKGNPTFFGLRVFFTWLINFLFFRYITKKKSPTKIDANIIGSLLYDRGMFSGFRVREFFYDLMIFAATSDTLFQRKLIEYFDGKTINVTENKTSWTTKIEISKKDLSYENFKIGKRSETKFNDENVKAIFNHLENLTFREFFEICGIDFGMGVSNYTKGSPVYFSDTWTPDFRVLEAVAASMSIPPAIRPLYNEADVFFELSDEKQENPYTIKFPRKITNFKLDVEVNGIKKEFVSKDGSFSQSDYNLYEYIVKKALQLDLLEKKSTTIEGEEIPVNPNLQDIYIDTNNLIDLNTFLPKLCRKAIGMRDKNNSTKRIIESLKNNTINVGINTYKVDKDLLNFYYNAQYKGLLLDGGYYHNIPYNYFRDKGDPIILDNVLALKLDRSFPAQFMERINIALADYKNKVEKIQQNVEEELLKISNNHSYT